MKKQGHDRTAIRERAKAARRAAQLRREAEERVEADRKFDNDEGMTINDVLAKLGSSLRVPEDEPDLLDYLKAAWQEGELETGHAKSARDWIKERNMAGRLPPPEPQDEKPKTKPRGKTGDYAFTAEEITRLRDEVGLSWRQVAVNLELGSPGAARKAYTTLTGRHYKDSAMTGRRARTTMGSAKASTRKVYAPDWNDDTDQDEIIQRLTGSRIIIERNVKGLALEEDLIVGRVVKLFWAGAEDDGPLTVDFIERSSGGQRSVLVQDIKEVR